MSLFDLWKIQKALHKQVGWAHLFRAHPSMRSSVKPQFVKFNWTRARGNPVREWALWISSSEHGISSCSRTFFIRLMSFYLTESKKRIYVYSAFSKFIHDWPVGFVRQGKTLILPSIRAGFVTETPYTSYAIRLCPASLRNLPSTKTVLLDPGWARRFHQRECSFQKNSLPMPSV